MPAGKRQPPMGCRKPPCIIYLGIRGATIMNGSGDRDRARTASQPPGDGSAVRMDDGTRGREQLLDELAALRLRVGALEALVAEWTAIETETQ